MKTDRTPQAAGDDAGAPRGRAVGAERVRSMATSVFTEWTELARRTGAINLGQGVPELPGPPQLLAEVAEAVRAGHNQYPPALGFPALREAVAAQQRLRYGLTYDPATEVLVTTGATEALAAALLALCDPGDEVLAFDPCYDAYPADARLAGARLVGVPLVPYDRPGGGKGFALDAEALRAAVTPRSRVLVLNSPHNPTGKVFTPPELAAVAAVCREHDLTVVTDEVYEHLVHGDVPHLPIATLPGMRERTLSVSSAGKTFNTTGWKVGWVCGPAPMVRAVNAAKQFLTYASGTPYQEALARALGSVEEWAARLRGVLRTNRDLLTEGLALAGLEPYDADAGYFVQADVRPAGYADGAEFCRDLPGRVGVVAIPTSAFYVTAGAPQWLVRFSFCRSTETLSRAVGRLRQLERGRA
jgi:N-succinyldiaminopimelate aminotransferase